MIDVSVIIVNYKSKVKLLSCLRSLEKTNWYNLSHETIVVDNASGDDLRDLKNVTIINSPINLGMGGGNNLGISNSRGEYVLILNPDTYVSSESVYLMWQHLKSHDEIGVLAPKLLNSDRTLQWSCFKFPTWYMPILRRTFLGNYFAQQRDNFTMEFISHDKTMEVDWLLGSCLFIPRKVFPGFDDRYFMYFEDIDLCRQIKFRGKEVVYFPETEVIHDHARQSANFPWYIAPLKDRLAREHIKSWVKYFIKWGL
jgi:GT2 family glycosyltransferase